MNSPLWSSREGFSTNVTSNKKTLLTVLDFYFFFFNSKKISIWQYFWTIMASWLVGSCNNSSCKSLAHKCQKLSLFWGCLLSFLKFLNCELRSAKGVSRKCQKEIISQKCRLVNKFYLYNNQKLGFDTIIQSQSSVCLCRISALAL